MVVYNIILYEGLEYYVFLYAEWGFLLITEQYNVISEKNE